MSAPEALTLVVLTATLLGVLWYAWEARKQAKASRKMAREMQEARYSGAKPFVDFRPRDFSACDWLRMGVGGRPPSNVDCRLRNVGTGPALNVTFRVSLSNGQEGTRQIGVLGAGEEMPQPDNILLELQEGGEAVARVNYDDVFGRCWESRLRIPIHEEFVEPWRVEIGEGPGK
ncbi:MAG: hypothetical protein Q7T33_01900 [Dehalococcoidia bacterium]|nr:hypothetical protein [Dehalococcoidia bacterium]